MPDDKEFPNTEPYTGPRQMPPAPMSDWRAQVQRHNRALERRRRSREGNLWQHVITVCLRILWHSHASTIRAMLGLSSLLWAIGVYTHPQSLFEYPYTIFTRLTLGPAPEMWVALFGVHFLGTLWRLFDPRQRVKWGLVVNSYGLALWLLVTIGLTVELRGLSPANATTWAITLFSGWALYKTGARDDRVSA